MFNHRRYCVVQTVVWPLQDRCATVAWPLCDRCMTVVWPLRERGGTISQPFHFSGRSIYTNAVCGATQLSALHNYRDRCSGIAYKRYCGIGTCTLYFKILTLVTAIIWQPGHWPQGYLHVYVLAVTSVRTGCAQQSTIRCRKWTCCNHHGLRRMNLTDRSFTTRAMQ